MPGSKTDFARLLRIQRVIKSMRERDLADARNRMANAEQSLHDLEQMMAKGGQIVDLFPDLVAKSLQNALVAQAEADREVKKSGDHVLREKKKLERIEDRHREERASQTRKDEATAQSETIDQRIARYLSASSKFGGLS